LEQEEALRITRVGLPAEPAALRQLDVRARRVLSLFAKAEVITAVDVAQLFGFSDRATRHLLQELVAEGVLAVTNTSNRARAYELSEVYRKFIGSLSEPESH
jgi:predicted ArsR family transcriptional regulator